MCHRDASSEVLETGKNNVKSGSFFFFLILKYNALKKNIRWGLPSSDDRKKCDQRVLELK